MLGYRLLLTAVLTATLAMSAPATASGLQVVAGGPKLAPAFAVKQQRASSAAEAARIAKQRYGGKILKVDAVRTGDGVLYRVKILMDNGRVKTVTIAG
ncbi:hypothetical protein F6455_10980 [Proteobacteria bacterium 005FR1]|nr:hypothetical protein [Proteobacteria bacterium 005FR1]